MAELDASVREAMRARLEDHPDAIRDLIAERDAAWRAFQATQVDRRAAALAEAEGLEREISHLVKWRPLVPRRRTSPRP